MAVEKFFDTWFDTEFTYEDIDITTHGHKLYFVKVSTPASDPKKNIIMGHGLTANSKICDIQYKGYSICRNYAAAGYTTWLFDASGHGFSEEWENPRYITTLTAAEDVIACAEKIKELQGVEQIDAFGWSWGTMYTQRAAALRPDLFRKLVWMSPPTKGNLPCLPPETFDGQEYAAFDYFGVARLFPIVDCPGGMIPPRNFKFDESRVEIEMVNKAIHDFFRYVGGSEHGRPIGPSIELMTGVPRHYVEVDKVQCPVFIAYGDDDGYVNVEVLEKEMLPLMPEGSDSYFCPGGTHGIPFDKKSIIVHDTIKKWLAK